jgi:hypothetical protein
MMAARRLIVAAALAALAVVAAAIPAIAAEDLDGYLREAEQAEYGGRRIVVTIWDGKSQAEILTVLHTGDTMTVNGGESIIGYGKLAGAPGGGVIIPEWSSSVLSDRYTMDQPEAVRRLGRDAVRIVVREGDAKRASIVLDAETSAPLATEVFDGEGTLFRYSTMIDFDANPAHHVAEQGADDEYEVMLPRSAGGLPATVAGYQRADTYAGPSDSVHAFYTDGLFYFSIFELPGGTRLGGLEDAAVVLVGGNEYRRLVSSGGIWVYWEGETAYLLVGDLPPDHLLQVLEELPQPKGKGNFISRLLRGIFG